MRSTILVILFIVFPPLFAVIVGYLTGNALLVHFTWILTIVLLVYILFNYTYKTKSGAGFLGNEEKYLDSIFKLAVNVMSVDGVISDNEIAWVEQALKENFKDKYAKKHIDAFTKLLKNSENIFTICKSINRNFRDPEKVQLLNFLIKLSAIDGKISDQEYEQLCVTCKYLRIHKKVLMSILLMFGYRINEQKSKRQSQRKSKTTRFGLNKSYQILGILETASDRAVKKAFRQLANIHHPDKVSHMGEKFQHSALVKFQKILEAYELIKVKRGL